MTPRVGSLEVVGVVLVDTADREEIIARVAALDIGKAEVVRWVRVPGKGPRGGRATKVTTYFGHFRDPHQRR